MPAFAADLRASGIGTSTFGVGADFDEELLTTIADAGHVNGQVSGAAPGSLPVWPDTSD